jgi:hypothetical protein
MLGSRKRSRRANPGRIVGRTSASDVVVIGRSSSELSFRKPRSGYPESILRSDHRGTAHRGYGFRVRHFVVSRNDSER